MPSLYQVLGVDRSAKAESLRRQYRKLAQKHHPDVNPDPKSHDLMAKINEAFEVLIDPMRRSEYDAMLDGGFGEAVKVAEPKKPVQVRLFRRLRAHRTPVYALSFDPETSDLVTGSFDNEIVWWDGGTFQAKRKKKLETGVLSTMRAFTGDRLVAAGSAETLVSMWDLRSGEVHSWQSSSDEWVSCIAISCDGNNIAAGSIHRSLVVSDTRNGKKVFTRKDHEQSVTAVAWASDGKVVATGSADNTVKLWNAGTGALVHTFKAVRSSVTALAFSPDNRFLAVAAVDLSIRVFSLNDGTLQKMMFGHEKPIEALAFHPNGWLFASAGRDGAVKLWNADKGLGQLHIEASAMPILALAFSPDGEYLAAGGLDKQVRLWEVKTKAE
ncbi:MAG TPA: DnaJ domain-containing protein [Fimbriimonadaceae bacterium]